MFLPCKYLGLTMYFFVFAPLLKDKKVINETNFFAFSRLIKKDPPLDEG